MTAQGARFTDPEDAWYCPLCSTEKGKDQKLKESGEGGEWQVWCNACPYFYPAPDERSPLATRRHAAHMKQSLRDVHLNCLSCYHRKLGWLLQSPDPHSRNTAAQFARKWKK